MKADIPSALEDIRSEMYVESEHADDLHVKSRDLLRRVDLLDKEHADVVAERDKLRQENVWLLDEVRRLKLELGVP